MKKQAVTISRSDITRLDVTALKLLLSIEGYCERLSPATIADMVAAIKYKQKAA